MYEEHAHVYIHHGGEKGGKDETDEREEEIAEE